MGWENTVIILIIAAFAGLLIAWFIIMLKFKHTVIIKELVKGRKIITRDKAKDTVIDGVSYWVLFKEKNKEIKLMPVPPAEAIEVTTKGRKWVEAYRTETGEYIFIKDDGQVAEKPKNLFKMPKEIEKIKDQEERAAVYDTWKAKKLKEWQDDNRVITAYEPLTSKQRLILINNIRKAHDRKSFSWQQNLPMLAGLGALVLIVVCLMIFYGEIAKPVIDMHDRELGYETMRTEQLKILRDIKQEIQTIGEERTADAPD